ncbi:MAG: amino acid permease [Eubacterium sp.]|nr:amino acid permease [Eubacterium sp.]
MKNQASDNKPQIGLQPYLSPAAAWALSVGAAVGWGSLVVTSNTYLAQAGPAGTVFGLLIGTVLMLLMCENFFYMANHYPRAGGAYTYTKEVFGYDRAFLVFWFLSLTYISMFWANATSLPLFARYFVGDICRFGYMFILFEYEVYFGEVLLTIVAVSAITVLCMRSKMIAAKAMTVMVGIFVIGITLCFGAAIWGHRGSLSPAFIPDGNALSRTLRIAFISPWAFIGFEGITHSVEEFNFKRDKLQRILILSVLTSTALYIFVTLLSITAYPEGCSSWLDYIQNCGSFSGIAGLPAFYAAHHYMGNVGVAVLMASLLSLVLTSLIANLRALSRLFYAAARDDILPSPFARLNDKQIPANAMLLVAALSIPMAFVGRTAIGWIVDVTTLGATMLYGFVSATTFKLAKKMKDRRQTITGFLGFGIMLVFGIYLLFPNLFSDALLETETYILFMVWTVLGFFYFRWIIKKDHARRFGKAIIVWIVLLSLVVFMAIIWSGRVDEKSTNESIYTIQEYYNGQADETVQSLDEADFIQGQIDHIHKVDTINTLLITVLFILALSAMLINHISMERWEKRAVEERDKAKETAFRDPLTGAKSKHAYLVSEKEFDKSIDESCAKDFAVVVCDVNGLKKINDTLGHKAGDEYICQAFGMICDIFQHSPVFRIGGDEFVVILTGRDYVIRKELVLALHDRSVEHIDGGGVVISGGLSEYRQGEDQSFHSVFERADALMYKEKQLLKGLGAVTRDDAEEASGSAVPGLNGQEILNDKRYILIVEDEYVNLMMLGNMLKGDWDLLYASDGVEALEQIKEHKDEIAIVLLDLQMPHMNGMEVLKVMKEERELADIPVIVLTADQSAEVKCLKIGAMDFIPKPYPSWEIVQARVHRCIELSEKRNIIESTERDPLTKLYNMNYFLNFVRMYDRQYTEMPMDAIVIDVNRFHMINERYGKQYGDSVLARIGERIRRISREVGGVGCRRVGDTFLIYCPHREDYEVLLSKASEGLVDEEASANRVRLRMGVYSNVDKTLEIERRFDYAKIAANTVRTGYSNGVGIYDTDMHNAELYRERLLEDFRPSLDNNRFRVFFQPKFDIRPDKPVLASAEALVRWDHPEMGMISPGVFIPLLEDNGLILELDKFVWNEAAARIRDWKDRFGYSVPVSVNVSRIDMLTPNLKGIFGEILNTYGLNPEDLMLEITESAYTEDAEQVISTARELRGMGMGFRIEMDDFGTGYSSLGMLSHLPIDVLKLDMSFVRSAFGETRDVRMIELIIDIADYLHVPVVAEGVETEEQYLVLKAMGCDFVQGYYFSKPVPPEAFDPFLIERGEVCVEMTPSVKKTYMSISKALTSDFESIFYVDVVSNYFLEFYTGKGGDLQIRPGGADFFGDVWERLLSDVCEEDSDRIRESLSKTSLMRWIGREETEALSFRCLRDGEWKQYSVQAIKTRSSDDHHIVIGVRPES